MWANAARVGKVFFRQNLLWRFTLFLTVTLLALEAQSTLVVQIGQNFTGSTFGIDSGDVPPDSNGAVGPNHFVEMINGRFSVYDKTTANRVQTKTDFAFWNAAGVTFGVNIFISDPRLVYDPTVQRWFAAAVDFNPNNLSNNRFLLAVSTGAAPTGSWAGLAFTADTSLHNFADFPTLGVDANGVYLGANMFSSGGTVNSGVTIVSIPKAGLLLHPPVATNRTVFGNMSISSRGVVLQPAVTFDPASGRENVIAVADLGYSLQPNTNLVSFGVVNAAGPGSASLSTSTRITVTPALLALSPAQPDGTTTLDVNDLRIGATAYQVANSLYAVHHVAVANQIGLRWYQINATNTALIQSGTITDSTLSFFYPSIAANASGTVVIGCNGVSSNSFISTYAVVGETVNGVTTFGAPIRLKAGLANYHNPSTGDSRWGDYSATSVDPNNPNTFWTIQMYPAGSSTWSTQITELRTVQLQLFARVAQTNLLVSWPLGASGFQLQSAPILATNANFWVSVPQTPFTTNGQNAVLVPISTANSFFRLQKL